MDEENEIEGISTEEDGVNIPPEGPEEESE